MLVNCSCTLKFCLKCRMPEDHSCKFDYKTAGKEMIEKTNVKIQFKKLEKI